MTDITESQLEAVVFQMEPSDDGPDFFDYLNPDLPRAELYDTERLLACPEVAVSEAVYWHFLEVLPPTFFEHGSFVMREALTDSLNHTLVISSKFSQRGERYFHQYVAIPVNEWEREVDA